MVSLVLNKFRFFFVYLKVNGQTSIEHFAEMGQGPGVRSTVFVLASMRVFFLVKQVAQWVHLAVRRVFTQ